MNQYITLSLWFKVLCQSVFKVKVTPLSPIICIILRFIMQTAGHTDRSYSLLSFSVHKIFVPTKVGHRHKLWFETSLSSIGLIIMNFCQFSWKSEMAFVSAGNRGWCDQSSWNFYQKHISSRSLIAKNFSSKGPTEVKNHFLQGDPWSIVNPLNFELNFFLNVLYIIL